MSEKWYAIRVIPGREKTVAESLRLDGERDESRPRLGDYLAAEGCEILMPTATEKKVRRGVKVTITRPAMPGYLFRRMDMTADAYHLVRETEHVIGFLPAKSVPLPISDDEIDMLLDAFDERFGESAEQQDLGWMVGKRFIIADGPFTSFPAECIGFTGKDVVMMVEIFGRLTPTTLPVTSIDTDYSRATAQDFVAARNKQRYRKKQRITGGMSETLQAHSGLQCVSIPKTRGPR